MPYLPAGPSPGTSAPTVADGSLAVLVTGDQALADECRLVAHSVGVRLEILPGVASLPGHAPRLVLAGSDTAQGLVGRHCDAVVVTLGSDPCAGEPVEVIRLPAGRARLASLLAEAVAPADGIELAVVGCAGGLGVTTLACAVARAARARACLLVEADRYGAGLDAVLGTEQEPGLRWDDLADVDGVVVAGTLTDDLPRWCDVSLLGHRFPPLDGPAVLLGWPAVQAVLRAARREFPLTVVDAGRGELLGMPDALLLVLRANLACVTVARRHLAQLDGVRAGVVVRDASTSDVVDVRSALAPWEPDIVSVLPDIRAVRPAAESGSLGVALRRRTLRQTGEACLDWLLGGGPTPGRQP